MYSTLIYSTRVRKEPASAQRLVELTAREDYLKGALAMSQAELVIYSTDYEKSNIEFQVKYSMVLRLGYDFETGITTPFPGEERIASDKEVARMAQVVGALWVSAKGHLDNLVLTTQQNEAIRWELTSIKDEFDEHAQAVKKIAAKAVRKAQRIKGILS